MIIGPTIVNSTVSSALTNYSDQYFRTGNTNLYYYQAINIIVNTTGNYTITSNSTVDTYGCLYKNSFNKTRLAFNRVAQNDDSGGNLQFKLTYVLQAGTKYILIVTTYSPLIYGPFSITVSGSASVGFHLNTIEIQPSSLATSIQTSPTTTTASRTMTTTSMTTTTASKTTTTTSKTTATTSMTTTTTSMTTTTTSKTMTTTSKTATTTCRITTASSTSKQTK
ncbi:unnamed protein product [Rotaria sp. Silwood2]|nr:unnamed protein product [Rotaria sp. Silwood2]CAF3192799.1 unnamed protein product [Rotaria sp. Silwood2]CAF3254652.1 unnamed protein product [Rotaria sp. Silwood2]CAF4290148.1 unnamed protein product [Rotaria sp. Silwood2]CAF4400359.1 unnamed protein product [Rotaria sp. Silwood2]